MISNWIDVKNRLPEMHETVLAWSSLDNNYVLASVMMSDGKWFCQPLYGVSYYTDDGISHWQELPDRIDNEQL